MRRPIIRDGVRIASAPPPIARTMAEAANRANVEGVFDDEETPTLSQRKQQAFANSLDTRKPKSERNVFTRAKFNARVKDVVQMRSSGEWENATAQHFVALYAVLHEATYNVAPLELNDDSRTKASMMASQCLRKHFGGDATEMAQFMNYVWTRERGRETWRRSNQKEGGRITWYRQFVDGAMVTDFIANQLRKGKT